MDAQDNDIVEENVNNDYIQADPTFSDQGRGSLLKQLFKWKRSVYKLIWLDTLLFAIAYFGLSFIYRYALYPHPVMREWFEVICVYCNKFGGLVPVAFLAGFYVSQVVTRWWDQYLSLPWPEKVAFKMLAFIPGKDPFNTTLRCTVMRYFNLANLLSYRMVSIKIMERFPTYQTLVDAGFLMEHEVEILKDANEDAAPYEATSIPITWAIRLIQRARTENKIEMEAPSFSVLINSLDYEQDCNRKMLNYGWMKFPLAYTQVAKWAVAVYFFAALFGRQYLIPSVAGLNTAMFPNITVPYSNSQPFDNFTPDLYVPIFTFVELLCYMGWIKIADSILTPFGDADEDFQVNYLIDRNQRISNLMVDASYEDFDVTDPFFLDAADEEEETTLDAIRMKKKLAGGWDRLFMTDI